MDIFSTCIFLRPWWFIALPLVGLLALRSAIASSPFGDWTRVIDPALMAYLTHADGKNTTQRRLNLTGLFVAALIIGSLTGPAIKRQDDSTFRNLDEAVIIIDLSRSITAGGNFQQVRQTAATLGDAAGTRPVAVVVYAGDAYMAMSPTTDRESLTSTLLTLDADTVPDRGSHPDRGLALARKVLIDANIINADIVLITDGDGIGESALREAQAIQEHGWHLHAIFVPAINGYALDVPKPDRSALSTLATAGGGTLADITSSNMILDVFKSATVSHLVAGNYQILTYRDFGRWLLLIAAIPVLTLFRRNTL